MESTRAKGPCFSSPALLQNIKLCIKKYIVCQSHLDSLAVHVGQLLHFQSSLEASGKVEAPDYGTIIVYCVKE